MADTTAIQKWITHRICYTNCKSLKTVSVFSAVWAMRLCQYYLLGRKLKQCRGFFSHFWYISESWMGKKKPLAKGWEAENPQFHDIQKSLKQAVYTSEVVSERTLPVKILECIHNYDQERSVSQRSFSDLSHACIKNYKTQTHHFQLSHMVILFWYPCNF